MQKRDSLNNYLETSFPAYFNLKNFKDTLSLKVIQEKLPSDLVLVDYFMGDSSIFIFTITKVNFSFFSIKKDSVFELSVKNLLHGIKQKRYDLFIKYSNIIYQKVFPFSTLLDSLNIRNICVIPDDILTYLPFECLISNKPYDSLGKNYSNLDYIVKKYNISYHYALDLFLNSMDTYNFTTHLISPHVMGVAPGIFSPLVLDDSGMQIILPELPCTVNEVEGIKEIFPSVSLLIKDQCTEQRMKATDFSQFQYLHIATHGILNEEKPHLSGLVFLPDLNNDVIEDGILYFGEIYNLSIPCHLLVLSACETGLGQMVKGEGLMGLTRAFIYAGAKNILVSLWKVSDPSTFQFMKSFYQHLSITGSNNQAIRKAKLDLINQPEYSAPFFWAPFILIGW